MTLAILSMPSFTRTASRASDAEDGDLELLMGVASDPA